jgi:hypothetical protein
MKLGNFLLVQGRRYVLLKRRTAPPAALSCSGSDIPEHGCRRGVNRCFAFRYRPGP